MRAGAVGACVLSRGCTKAIGAAVGWLLLEADGKVGLAGWQWVFIATGIPAILLAPVVLLTLPRGRGEARWLTTEQKAWLASALATSAEGVADEGNVWRTFTDRSEEHTSELQ